MDGALLVAFIAVARVGEVNGLELVLRLLSVRE